MKTILKDLIFYDLNKDNQPYLDKKGRPYSRVRIKTEAHGKESLSGFAYEDSPVKKWKVGTEIDIETEEIMYNGKKYLNFKTVYIKVDPTIFAEKVETLNRAYLVLTEQMAVLSKRVDALSKSKDDKEEDPFDFE